MTEAQHRFMRKAMAIEDAAGGEWRGVFWEWVISDRFSTVNACIKREWVHGVGVYQTTLEGRDAVAEYERSRK